MVGKGAGMRKVRPFWNEDETNKAQTMKRNGHTLDEIGKALGRTANAVSRRLSYFNLSVATKKQPHNLTGYSMSVPADVLESREVRLAAPQRDLTGHLFGDPPVGYSALERRT